jgi:hypothetical protein
MFLSSHIRKVNAYSSLKQNLTLFFLHRPLIKNFALKFSFKKTLIESDKELIYNIITYITIARQRLGKRILVTQVHATRGNPLLGNDPVNTFPHKSVRTIVSSLLSNGAVRGLREQYRLCFPLVPCKVVTEEALS